MEHQMLNRRLYKEIKAMDRNDMEIFLSKVYIEGHEAAVRALSKQAETEQKDTENVVEEKSEESKELTPVLKLIDDMYFGEIKGVGMAITNKVQAHARAKGYLEL